MIVKENSIIEFFKTHVVGFKEPKEMQHFSLYYLMSERLFVKGIPDDVDNVEFIISDQSKNTNTKLTNTYKYNLYGYDDVCSLLDLIGFEVKVTEVKK